MEKEVTEYLRAHYPEIIDMTQYHVPENYEIIDFKKFLIKQFGQEVHFVDVDRIALLRTALINKYQNEKNCFKYFGSIQEVEFSTLSYYQEEVGIRGPKFHQIDDPVYILQVENMQILWEGYHRALVKIIDGKEIIRGYVLTLQDNINTN
ncbi:MAG TPA: hypothetical protein VF487_12415 [Chitinophagaceae bacterium]